MSESSMTTAALHALNEARDHVLEAADGLSATDLRRATLPSGWNLVELINHLTIDVERWWFRAVVAAEPEVIAGFDNAADGWQVPPDADPDAIIAAYREECRRADRVLASANLDAAPGWWPPDVFGDWRLNTVADVLLHVVVETASHAGHADATRELLDGKQWLVLTEA